MKKYSLCGLLAAALATACATPPEKIVATPVSASDYQVFDCNQVRQELLRVHERVNSIAGMQRVKAQKDAVAVGVGLVIYWPALFLVAGKDMDIEIASLKGQYDALTVVATEKKCPIAVEMGLTPRT